VSTLSIRRPRRQIVRRPFGAGILPPEPDRNDLDRVWLLGFELGRAGTAAMAPTDWHDLLKDFFFDGYGSGEVQRDADLEAEFQSELDMLATFNSEEGGQW
jgi:hypothetical protein